MYCTNCGAKLEPDARFCAQCGTRVVKPEPAVTEVEPAEVAAEQAAPEAETEILVSPDVSEDVCECCGKAEESAEAAAEPAAEAPAEEHEHCECCSEEEQNEPVHECACCGGGETEALDEPAPESAPEPEETAMGEPNGGEEEPRCGASREEDTFTAPAVSAEPVYGGKKPQAAKPSRRTSVGGHIACVFCAIFLAIFLTVTYAVTLVQHVFDGDTLVSFVNDLDPSRLDVDDIASSGILSDYGIVYDDGETLLDIIYNNLGDDRITKKQLESILNSKKISAAASQLISDTIDRMLSGKRGSVLKTSDIMKIIKDNRKTIESVVGYTLTDEDMQRIESLIEENFGEAISAVSVDNIDFGAADAVRGAVRTLLSKWLLVALCAICLILSVLIIVCARSFRVGLNYVGAPFILVGLLWSVSMGALMFGIPGIPFKSLANAISSLATKPLFIAASMFLFGVICIGVGIIIRGASARKARRA